MSSSGVVPSGGFSIPYYLRSWLLRITTQAGPVVVLSSDNTPGLKLTFEVETRLLQAYWIATITLYNADLEFDASSANGTIFSGVPVNQLSGVYNASNRGGQPVDPSAFKTGDQISLSAGYQFSDAGAFNPRSNLIFEGNVFQPMWTRENVVDRKLTLRCMMGFMQDAFNFLQFSVGGSKAPAGSPTNALQVVEKISADSGIPIDNIDDAARAALSQQTFSRSTTVFGRPSTAFQQYAKDAGISSWISPHGLNMRSLKFDSNTVPDFIYVPPNLKGYTPPNGTRSIYQTTLLGVPEQTQDGILFRVLMDAKPRIASIVQVPNPTAINRVPFVFGQVPAVPAQFGIYVITAIRYVGDTRGNDWATEIQAVTSSFFGGDFLGGPASAKPNVTGN